MKDPTVKLPAVCVCVCPSAVVDPLTTDAGAGAEPDLTATPAPGLTPLTAPAGMFSNWLTGHRCNRGMSRVRHLQDVKIAGSHTHTLTVP